MRDNIDWVFLVTLSGLKSQRSEQDYVNNERAHDIAGFCHLIF